MTMDPLNHWGQSMWKSSFYGYTDPLGVWSVMTFDLSGWPSSAIVYKSIEECQAAASTARSLSPSPAMPYVRPRCGDAGVHPKLPGFPSNKGATIVRLGAQVLG